MFEETVDAGTAELLASARTHLPVILVSNATTRLETDLDQLGIAALDNGRRSEVNEFPL